MPDTCDFPGCDHPATTRMCDDHHNVRIADSGSWVNDTHLEGGHG